MKAYAIFGFFNSDDFQRQIAEPCHDFGYNLMEEFLKSSKIIKTKILLKSKRSIVNVLVDYFPNDPNDPNWELIISANRILKKQCCLFSVIIMDNGNIFPIIVNDDMPLMASIQIGQLN